MVKLGRGRKLKSSWESSDDLGAKKPVLVTGAAGFVGFHVVKQLLQVDEEVIAVDSLASGLYPAAEKIERFRILEALHGVRTVVLDLNNWKEAGSLLDDVPEVRGAIHLAAMPGLRLSWDHLPLYSSSNIDATGSALEITARKGGGRFLHVSTSSVYGARASGVGQQTSPVSPYGITKLAAEQLVEVLSQRLGLSFSIVRLFSVYGPHQRPDMAYRRFIEAALFGRNVPLYGDGAQTRTNTYVTDAAAGIVSAFLRGSEKRIYDIGGDEETSILDAIARIEQITGRKVSLIPELAIQGDQISTKANLDLATQDLGFKNSITLEEGLRSQATWIKNRAVDQD